MNTALATPPDAGARCGRIGRAATLLVRLPCRPAGREPCCLGLALHLAWPALLARGWAVHLCCWPAGLWRSRGRWPRWLLAGRAAVLAGHGRLAALHWMALGNGLLVAEALAGLPPRGPWPCRRSACRTVAGQAAELAATRQQMQQALEAAEAAAQAKSSFLAAASHDLRQPAHALGLYTAALRAGPLAPEQAEIASRMQASLAALDAMFAALLDVSRMDAGAVAPQWDTVSLAPLLHRLAVEWAPQAEARGLRLAVHVSDPWP
jgi:signal transduction histidine kinase